MSKAAATILVFDAMGVIYRVGDDVAGPPHGPTPNHLSLGALLSPLSPGRTASS